MNIPMKNRNGISSGKKENMLAHTYAVIHSEDVSFVLGKTSLSCNCWEASFFHIKIREALLVNCITCVLNEFEFSFCTLFAFILIFPIIHCIHTVEKKKYLWKSKMFSESLLKCRNFICYGVSVLSTFTSAKQILVTI